VVLTTVLKGDGVARSGRAMTMNTGDCMSYDGMATWAWGKRFGGIESCGEAWAGSHCLL
jgi:hypothetical protein